MSKALGADNRREFLKLSGTIAVRIIGTTLVAWIPGSALGLPEPQNRLPGFDPEKVDARRLKAWTGSAVNSVNSILAGTAMFSDFDSLASTYQDCLLYLHDLNFDGAGTKYIVEYKYLPAPAEQGISGWYEQVAKAGLRINRENWNAMIAKSRDPKILEKVEVLFRQGKAVQFHKDVSEAIRSAGKETPALHARNQRLVLSNYQARGLQAKFADQTCMYLDWGGVYLGVVALPIGITPVGAALGVFAIGLWAIAKLGGC